MKFCGNCGAQQPDEAVTCEKCGSPLPNTNAVQPQQPQQPVQSQYQQYPAQVPMGKLPSNPTDKKNAVAALVLGIIGLVCGWVLSWTGIMGVVGLVVSVIGVALAVKARNAIPVNGDGRGLATGGLVCGILGIVFNGIIAACVLCTVGCTGCAACAESSAYSSDALREILDSAYYIVSYVGTLLHF